MTDLGVKSPNITSSDVLDSVVGNRNRSTRLTSVAALAKQLAGTSPLSLLGNQSPLFKTRALLLAATIATKTTAWVFDDPTVAYNGIYSWTGTAWEWSLPLPYSFIRATNAGVGTPNALQATTDIPVSEAALIILPIVQTNTESSVTVSFNGAAALTIKTNSGSNPFPGGLPAGMIMIGVPDGSDFRLMNDPAIAAVAEAFATAAQNSAIASQNSAVASAASAANALVSETNADLAASRAEASAAVTGVVGVFNTYADALAGLSGLTNGNYVEVIADETHASHRSRYEVVAGAYVYRLNLTVLKYVKSHLYDYALDEDGHSTLPELVTDWRLSMQAALADRHVLLPAGDIPFTGTVNVPVPVRGAGMTGEMDTVLVPNGGTGDIFTLGNGVDDIHNIHFRNFRILPSAQRTGGWAFNFKRAVEASGLHGVRIGTPYDWYRLGGINYFYGGLFLDRFDQFVVDSQSCVAGATEGIVAAGNADYSYGAELLITGGTNIFACTTGVHIAGGCGGIRLSDLNIILGQTSLLISRNITDVPNSQIFLGDNFTADICSVVGVDIRGSSVLDFHATGSWFASCQNNTAGNFLVRADLSGDIKPRIYLTGCRNTNSSGWSYAFSGGDIQMDCCHTDLSYSPLRAFNGAKLVMRGGSLIKDLNSDDPGIIIEAGVDGYIDGVDVTQNGPVGIENNSAQFKIRNCPGYKTRNRGAYLMTSGTTATFPHGLSVTPDRNGGQIIIAALSRLGGSGVDQVWCSNADATNVEITTDAAVTSPLSVSWDANVE